MLDSETPSGQRYIDIETQLVDYLCDWLDCESIKLKSNKAHFDRFFFRDGILISSVEIKSREMSLDRLLDMGSFLLTADKIHHGSKIAELTKAPFFLFSYLIESRTIVWWQVADEDGLVTCEFKIKESGTKPNCNASENTRRTRKNAFISLHDMGIKQLGPESVDYF